MPKSENQKYKALYVAKYLMEATDENHAVSATDILDYLEDECGITADRRSIYRDIAALRDVFGMDIDGGQGGRYRLVSRDFSFEDLRTLAECVRSTKFISDEESDRIVESLETLCSEYQAEQLRAEVYNVNRGQNANDDKIIHNVNLIYRAMATRVDNQPHEPHKIKFKYLTHKISNVKSSVERREGKFYTASPYKLLVDNGNYYLMAYEDGDDKIRTFRVDRMKDIKELHEKREGRKLYDEIDIRNYTRRVFTMFGGEKTQVIMQFSNDLLDTVIDRFGTENDVMYQPHDSGHFKVITTVEISNQFFGWLSGLGTKALLVQPQKAKEKYKAFLESIFSKY